MWKYDGLTYPEVGEDMLKHKPLGLILRAQMKELSMTENYLFVDALAKGVKPKALYENFIDLKGKYMVNISADMRSPMDELAKRRDFESPVWSKFLARVKQEVLLVTNRNVSSTILVRNKAFMAYHKSRKWQNKGSLIRQYKLSQETKKVAKLLKMDISDAISDAIGEAAVALKYNPKSAGKPITLLANSSKKKLSTGLVKDAIMKAFKTVKTEG